MNTRANNLVKGSHLERQPRGLIGIWRGQGDWIGVRAVYCRLLQPQCGPKSRKRAQIFADIAFKLTCELSKIPEARRRRERG
jgi:hypothetical protein